MGRNRTYDREEVLEIAMTLFWKKGYEGTHLQELVSATKLNRFSLYKEFNGKQGIFSEAINKYLNDAKTYYQPLLQKPNGLSNIFAYFDSIQFSKGFYGCFAVKTLSEQHIVNQDEFIKVKVFFLRIEQAYYDNLRIAQDKLEISKNKNTIALSKLLMSIDLGLSIYGIIAPNNSDDKLITSLVKDLLGIVVIEQ
jgi:TetR/AcrR family transcriptional repressor of nem operon